ncbi:structural maintenance of chromosome 3 (chondroitin sulfate proteoglycan 6), partial [Mytilus galloprovincialis]
IEKDEVVLRRVIGSKKDQYFLDKKMVTKGDVMNLLESAGFSRSNPYYIVKQGKINQMATAPDSQRLKLLREVAGTKVYDERKEESKVILRETEGKREKINDLLKYIEERLATLEEEKEELKEYQKWDKMRRSLEYTIHDHELRDTRKKLDELQDKRENSGTNTQKIRDLQQSSTDKVKAINKDLRDLKSRMQSIHDEKEQLTSENQDLTKKKAKLELNIKDIQDELEGDKSARKKAEEELKKVSDKIVKTQNQLEEITPKYDAEQRKEEECTRQLSMAEQRRKELYAKQGRGNQFTSRDDRDAWIKKELKSLNRAIRDKEEQIKRLREDLVNDDKRAEHLRTQIEEVSTKIDQNKDIIGQNDKNSIDMKRERDVLMNDRNALWRQENILQQEISSTREELSKKEQALRSMTGKQPVSAFTCLNNVDRLSECCHPCNKMDNKYRCTSLCPKDFFIIKRTTDLKCSQKGSIIIFEDSDIDESMQPLCVRWCPERYQNSSKTECQFCDEGCNVTVAMKHFDKVNGISIGLSSLALAFCLVITFIILYCVFKRRRIKKTKANPTNNTTYDSASTPVIKSNNGEIRSKESYTQHGGVTVTIDNAEDVSNTSDTLEKDYSPDNSNRTKDGRFSEYQYLENNSLQILCVAELKSKCYGLQPRTDLVSNHESITVLDIENGTFLNPERVIIQNIDNMIVKGNPTISVGHVIGISVSD